MNSDNNVKSVDLVIKLDNIPDDKELTMNSQVIASSENLNRNNIKNSSAKWRIENGQVKKKGKNLHDVKKENQSLVLKLICTGQCKSRMEITRKTGLTKMTVTNIIQQLISDNIVCEGDLSTSKSVGRKSILLFPEEKTKFAIGVYISRDEIIISLLSLSARIVKMKTVPLMELENQDTLIKKIMNGISFIQEEVDRDKIIGIGVACIGPLDMENGILLSPSDFYGIENVELKKILEDWSSLPVIVNNDMNSAALAEQLYGDGVGTDHFIYFGITHGVGSGIIANGKLFAGAKGYGGEIGHVSIQRDGPQCSCGNKGCLEVYASMPVFLERCKREAALENHSQIQLTDNISFSDIIELAINGDVFANKKIDELCLAICSALINAIHILNSSKVFIGHESALGGEWFTQKIEDQLNLRSMFRKTSAIKVQISKFKEHSPVVGSGILVFDQFFQGNL